MSSTNATAVALEVKARVGKGVKVNLGEIIKKQGYAPGISHNPTKVTKTKSYQAVIVPFVRRLEQERDRALVALSKKDLDLEDSRILKDIIDSFTKNIQLLSGKATENVATVVNVINYAREDLPSPETTLQASEDTPQLPN